MLVLFSRILLLHAICKPMIFNCTQATLHTASLYRIFQKLLSTRLLGVKQELHLAANNCLVFPVKNPNIYSSNRTYTLAYSCLSHVNLIHNLGITIHRRLKLDKHVFLITEKALVHSRFILRCFHSCDCCLLKLFVCMCISCLNTVALLFLFIVIT